MKKKLYKSRENQVISGVCGGIAEYFSTDVTIVRLAFVLFSFLGGPGILAYIICMFVMPEAPREFRNDFFEDDDETIVEAKYTEEDKTDKVNLDK